MWRLALFSLLFSPLSFLLSYFLRTGCCHNNKGKSTRTEKQTGKIIDNSGWVWLTGVNLASLKMGLNQASRPSPLLKSSCPLDWARSKLLLSPQGLYNLVASVCTFSSSCLGVAKLLFGHLFVALPTFGDL
jgi:hypothetical protein